MDDARDAALLIIAVVSGLLLLYVVIRIGVRDGVLDARARDDQQLAERRFDKERLDREQAP